MSTSGTGVSGWVCRSTARAPSPPSDAASARSSSTGGLCFLIAYGLFAGGDQQAAGNWALGIFLALGVLTVGTVGFTPGKRLLGLRVASENGGRLSFGWAVVRTALLCLAIPALVWDRDGRGLHDRLARAVQVRI